MRTVIIEDEKPISDLLHLLINEIDPAIEICGKADNIRDAASLITTAEPDLAFLDVMLPGGTAFDILESLPGFTGEIIFVTAHDRFMLQALQHAAVGFVLKPIQKKELQHAIEQAKKRLNKTNSPSGFDSLIRAIRSNAATATHKIAVPSQTGFIFIHPEEIIRCEGLKTYTWIYLKGGQKILSSYNLGEFRKILSGEDFFQVHKSHIISLQAVKKFDARDCVIELADKTLVPLAKRNKASFIQHFSIPNRD